MKKDAKTFFAAYCEERFVVTSDGVFEGRALTFGEPDDNYGLTFEPDAFDESIEERGIEGIKLLYEHDPLQPVGAWKNIFRTEDALRVRGKLTLETAKAKEVKALMEDGSLNGLSVGFAVQEMEGTHVIKADLMEISVCVFPADRTATMGLDGLKTYPSNSALPKAVRQVLSSEALTIYRKAFNKYAANHPEAPQSRAQAIAWRAVKKKYGPPQKEAGMWVKKMDGSASKTEMSFADAIILDGVRRSADGYLAADAKVARTGIQLYRGADCGRPDMDIVRVYRPPEQVFATDAMHSFAHRPVTLEHPAEMVDASNWKHHAIGHTGDEVVRDGEFIRVPLVLMDGEAIKAVEAGKRELSMGYTTEIEWTPGETKDGEAYDAIQTAIRANHLAVVSAARGGPNLRIGDGHHSTRKDDEMPELKTVAIDVDGVEVQVVDTSAAYLKKFLSNQAERLQTLASKMEEEEEAKKAKAEEDKKAKDAADAAIAAKDAEIASLKEQVTDSELTPDKLDQAVTDRAELIGKAKAICDSLTTKGRTNAEIRKQVVTAKLGDTAKAYSDEQVMVAFDTLTAGLKPADGTKDFATALADAETNVKNDSREKAYDSYDQEIGNRWKTGGRPQASA